MGEAGQTDHRSMTLYDGRFDEDKSNHMISIILYECYILYIYIYTYVRTYIRRIQILTPKV